MGNMADMLSEELEYIDALHKVGLTWVEYSAYALGINIAPRKRSSKHCFIIRVIALIVNIWIIYSLIKFIVANYRVSFEAYVEAVLLTFQISVGVIKMFHFQRCLDICVRVLRNTETGAILKSSGIFSLDLPRKRSLSKEVACILLKSWVIIDRQVMFFFKIVCMPVLYYTMRPYFQYIYDCYILQDICEISLTYPAIVPFIRMGKYEYPSFLVRFFLLQSGPFWCFFAVFGFNSLFVVLTGHVVGLLQVLRYLVQNSTSDTCVPQHLRASYLRCCIKLFSRVSRHHAEIESLFKYFILVQCVVSCILICMLLYKISTALVSKKYQDEYRAAEPFYNKCYNLLKEVGWVMLGMIMVYLITITLEISLYNVNAQRVESQSELLYFDWYNCEWYNESPDFKFLIKMMLLFSNRTFVLSVGGFTNLSHKFLVQVFRMSANFFLLLRNVYNK